MSDEISENNELEPEENNSNPIPTNDSEDKSQSADQFIFEGIVYKTEGKNNDIPRKDVIVNLYNTKYSSSQALATAVSKEDGKFVFDLSDDKIFPTGAYKVYAGKGEKESGDIKLRITRGKKMDIFPIFLKEHPISRKVASGFTLFTMLLLVSVLIVAFKAHQFLPKDKYKPLLNLVDLSIDHAKDYESNYDSEILTCDSLFSDRNTKLCQKMDVYKSLAALDSVVFNFGNGINKSERVVVSEIVNLCLQSDSYNALSRNLEQLKTEMKVLDSDYRVWDGLPWKFLEIYLWAFIAVLVRIILYNGRHIYKDTFRKWAFAQQLSFILCVPIIALIIVMVFSLLNFKISSSAFTLDLDLSNLYLNIVIATLIGFVPWKSWHYLISLSDGLFKILPAFPKNTINQQSNDA